MRNLRSFIARRLLRAFPLTLPGIGDRGLLLRNKFEVASARDVFCSANYWRMFEHLLSPPRLVVDLGAHCGHFAILAHLMTLERFGLDDARYVLVEPLPALIETIKRNVSDIGIASQVRLVQGLVGRPSGTGLVAVSPKNLLVSSVVGSGAETPAGARLEQASYVDLKAVLPPDEDIDVLKVDIEGSEHVLLRTAPEVFERARLLAIEMHGELDLQNQSLAVLEQMGFRGVSPSIVNGRERLMLLARR